jgi:hypothetical protein
MGREAVPDKWRGRLVREKGRRGARLRGERGRKEGKRKDMTFLKRKINAVPF